MRSSILLIGAKGRLGRAVAKSFSDQDLLGLDAEDISDSSDNLLRSLEMGLSGIRRDTFDIVIFAHRKRTPNREDDPIILDNEVRTVTSILDVLINQRLISVGGKVLLFSSVNSARISGQGLYYHLAKACTNQMVRWYADKLRSYPISVNGISLGLVTSSKDAQEANTDLVKVAKRSMIDARPTLFNEAAELVKILVNFKSNQLTGEVITLDGGYSLLDLHEFYVR